MKAAARRPASKASPGPFRAVVLEVVDEDSVLVRRIQGGGEHRVAEEVIAAEMAVVGYLPQTGDQVLVSGTETPFVTGAFGEARRRTFAGLTTTKGEDGSTELHASGDLTLSTNGRLALRGVDLSIESTEQVQVRTGRLDIEADRVIERAKDTYRHVEGLAELQAQRARMLVEDTCRIVAGKTTIASEEDTIVDGKRVLLG